MSERWVRHGFLNTLEHGVTRFADAGVSIVLLWALPTEVFARLAVAQAVTAPLLLLFVQPEAVIYRDFAAWKQEGPSALAARVHALRVFGWGKAQLAVILAALIALSHRGSGSWGERFAAMIFALSIALAPQIAGADREFLRMDLRLRELNLLSLLQKLTILGGVVGVAFWVPPYAALPWLALIAGGSTLVAALLARIWTRRALLDLGATPGSLAGAGGPSVGSTLTESLRTFSIWNHLAGVIQNSVQTLDLFFLGLFRFPGREVGLYAAVLKLANFSTALPQAMASLFSVWLGRTPAGPGERARVLRFTAILLLLAAFQGAAIWFLAPYIFGVLSHGRWETAEIERMQGWVGWVLAGTALFAPSVLGASWRTLRGAVREFFALVSVPWLAFAAVAYAGAVHWGGIDAVARANVAVGGLYFVLVCGRLARKASP